MGQQAALSWTPFPIDTIHNERINRITVPRPCAPLLFYCTESTYRVLVSLWSFVPPGLLFL